jgi:hypothetical protein
MSAAPDWSLIRFIARTAADPRWSGGIRREHLAELAGLQPHGRPFTDALAVAIRTHRVDFCEGFIVPPR